jgi:hypothetical protein
MPGTMTIPSILRRSLTICIVLLTMNLSRASAAADHVDGNLILLNDNGAWCWYQDERAVVDTTNNTIVFGSVAAAEGIGGEQRSGDVDVVSYNLNTGQRTRFTLHHKLQVDDHNTPGLLIRPDGKYVAVYSRHNSDKTTYWRVSTNPHDASAWDAEQTFDWSKLSKENVTYANLFYLPAEKKTYDIFRGINTDATIMTSDDYGTTWSYVGKLLNEPRLGYVNGYPKYASNGVDRIDIVTTEHHPRDFNNSVYHGFIKRGKLHKSDGTVIDDNIFDDQAPRQTELTKVFAADSVFDGVKMTHAWTMDLHIDKDGNPFTVVSARANDEPDSTKFDDHRFFYCRHDGSKWNVHYLAKAGPLLFQSEQDYTGLVALHPNDPNTLYISSTVDPRSDSNTPKHEIYKGVTTDGGASWKWEPLTQNSSVDNLRPIIPIWDADNTAVMWFRGTMTRSQHYDMAIVGVIRRQAEQVGPEKMLGGELSGSGAVPVSDLSAGTYDLFVHFRAKPGEDVRIRAGLKSDDLLTFRSLSSQQLEDGTYRGYLGRVTVAANASPITVHIADKDRFAGVGAAKVVQGK